MLRDTGSTGWISSRWVGVSFVVRQKCAEDGAAGAGLGVASSPDAAAVPGDDVARDPEAESVAFVLLGGEEGIEDFGNRVLRDAGSVVEEGDGRTGTLAVAPGLRFANSDRKTTVLGHRVDCVCDLVGEDLAQFALESPDFEFVAILFL